MYCLADMDWERQRRERILRVLQQAFDCNALSHNLAQEAVSSLRVPH